MESRNLTIMLTDIVGFTARTSRMSRKAMIAMLELHDQLIPPVILHYKGRVVKALGDAFLSVFESPTNAVLCAIQIQHTIRMYNKGRLEKDQLHIRIALNAGEVQLSRKGDVFGEAVNITARLESVTESDEIYFTEQVYLLINRNEIPKTLLVQKFSFKGIEDEIKVYKVIQNEDDETYCQIVQTDIEFPSARNTGIAGMGRKPRFSFIMLRVRDRLDPLISWIAGRMRAFRSINLRPFSRSSVYLPLLGAILVAVVLVLA